MGVICSSCGRDIDALGQDNMSCTSEPLCEDCWNEQQNLAAESLRREVRDLRFENARLREKLDARAEETAAPKATKFAADAVKDARLSIEAAYEVSRERALALTKLDECEMWLGRCTPRETAAPAHGEAAAGAAQRVDVDAALASRDPMEDMRRLMLRSAVD